MTRKPAADVEKSAYVRELEAALDRYLATTDRQEKRAIEREVAAIIGTQKGLNAWKAKASDVSHGTTRDPRCPKRRSWRVGRRCWERFDRTVGQVKGTGESE